MNVPENLRYTKDHEWLKVEGGKGIVGITDYAQQQLGDVVFVEVPEAGKKVKRQGSLSVVESVKAVSDIFSPVAGVVIHGNDVLTSSPELVNQDPYGDGWIAEIEIDGTEDMSELMDAAAYRQLIGEGK